MIKKFFRINSNVIFFTVLVLTIFCLYAKTLHFSFVEHDDSILISDNINYISDIKNIPSFFTKSVYYSNTYTYYRPVLTLSFTADALITYLNPAGYHVSNILLFTAAVISVYFFFLTLGLNKTVSQFVSVLFAVHPVFASTVAWIPARNDSIFAVFVCFSFVFLSLFINKNKYIYLFLYISCFTVSLFTKETAVILMPMYCLFVYCFNYKISKKQIFKTISVLFAVFVFYFILRNKSVAGMDLKNIFLNRNEYIANFISGMTMYIDKFIVPDYIPVMMHKIKISVKTLSLTLFSVLASFFLCYKKYITKKEILFSYSWVILFLLPTFLQSDYCLLFHRFFVPSTGIFILIIIFISKIIENYPVSKKYLIMLFVVLYSVFVPAAYVESDKYSGPGKYWVNAYLDSPDFHISNFGLGRYYILNGNYEKGKELIYKAQSLDKKQFKYMIDIASILVYEGKIDEAEQMFLKLSESAEGKNETCFYQLSKIYMQKRNTDKALFYAQKAVELQPSNITYLKLTAGIYLIIGEYEKAEKIYLTLLKYDKSNITYKYQLSLIYEDLGNIRESAKYMDMVAESDGNNTEYKERLEMLKTKI